MPKRNFVLCMCLRIFSHLYHSTKRPQVKKKRKQPGHLLAEGSGNVLNMIDTLLAMCTAVAVQSLSVRNEVLRTQSLPFDTSDGNMPHEAHELHAAPREAFGNMCGTGGWRDFNVNGGG